jgi:hypothetical protein
MPMQAHDEHYEIVPVADEETKALVRNRQSGRAGWALAWVLGVPLPLLLVIWLFSRAC